MSRLSSAREPINPKDQIQLPIDAYPGGRNDAQNLDAQSLIRAAQGNPPFQPFLASDPSSAELAQITWRARSR